MVLSRIPVKNWKIAVNIAALIPLVWLGLDAILGSLSINPYEDLIRRTGQTAIMGLILTLSCTPFAWWLKIPAIQSLRKPLGLYTFFYAVLHVSTFLVLGYSANLNLAIHEILARPFLMIGLTAFLILLILAFTSNHFSQKILTKHWDNIHRLIYLAALLAGSHYLMARKITSTQSIIAAVVIAVLLLFRLVSFFSQTNSPLSTNNE